MPDEPVRPASVPEDAWWVEEDQEWELGPKNEAGEKHGDFQYWRADGTLCNQCQLVQGTPDGPFKRFHENGEVSQEGSFKDGKLHGTRVFMRTEGETSEQMPEGLAEGVWRAEMEMESGRVTGGKLYDREGNRVLPDGSAYPSIPEGVPEEAQFSEEREQWVTGGFDEDQRRTGAWHFWDEEGALVEEAEFREGEYHGTVKEYRGKGQVKAVTLYAGGRKAGTFQQIVEPGVFADGRIRIEKGSFDDDFAVGVWRYFDARGQAIAKLDLGAACKDDDEFLQSPAFKNEAGSVQTWSEVSRSLLRERHVAEGICASARAAAEQGTAEPLLALLERAVVPLSDEEALQAALQILDAAGESLSIVCNALVRGADPAALFRGLAVVLDQKLLSRAALDYINAALLLAPERLEYYFTRSLVNMSLGNDMAALDDAESLAPKEPENAIFLKNYARVLFPEFDFWPARETAETHFDGLPEAPAQDAEAIRKTMKKYATRLMQIREAMFDKVEGQPDWQLPDVSQLLPEGHVELGAWQFEIPDPDDPEDPFVIDVDEKLDIGGWELPALLRAARADWSALCWLCWAVGLGRVALPEKIQPPADFGVAAGMAAARLWRCRDRRITGGYGAQAQDVPGFTWEGMDIDDASPHLVQIAEGQYAEMQAMFYWLTGENNQSPWQDNLRGS